MKKIIFVFLGLFITIQAIGAISPLDKKLQKAKKEYANSQKQCPDDKPLYVDGNCVACDEYNNWNDVAGVLGCEKCKNSSNCFGNHCCINCPEDKPVLLSNGSCVSCDYKPVNGAPIYDVIKGRDRCQKCPDDKPVLLRNGDCKTCDQVLNEYKEISQKEVLAGWKKCSFDKKYKQNTKLNKPTNQKREKKH